jgi:ribosomal protein S18 acetylase RimI-like enzyme
MKLSEKGIIIRKTVEDDLPQIYAEGMNESQFSKLTFLFTAENIADIFASADSICFTAVRKKKVLGFILGSVKEKDSFLCWIMVKDKFRRAGIGKELLKMYVKVAEKSGVKEFIIDVYKNNAESVKFFTDNGFEMIENFIELQFKVL